MANEPKDPNSTTETAAPPLPVDPAIAAAEAAMAQARAAEAAAAAARARAEALLKQAAPPAAIPAAATHTHAKQGHARRPTGAIPAVNPQEVRLVAGGEFRTVLQPGSQPRRSSLAMITGFLALFGAAGFFVFLVTNADAKARMDAALSGNTCGPEEDQSCFMLLVTKDKIEKEAQWLKEDLRARPIYGAFDLKFNPPDAKVEIFQIAYRISAEEWAKETPGKGTPVCTKDPASGKDVCATPYKALVDESNGVCGTDKVPVEVASLTGTPIISIGNFYVPIHTLKRDCATGVVSEAYNYDYRVVLSHPDYDTRSFTIQRFGGWQQSLGVYSLTLEAIDLVPKPEIMKDAFLKVRNQLFCWMKSRQIDSIEKVSPDQFDAFRNNNGFRLKDWPTLFDRTETFWTTGANKDWWDGQWKEIQAQKCDDGQDKKP